MSAEILWNNITTRICVRVCVCACRCMSVYVSLCIQKSKGLWGSGTASASRPSLLLARDSCVAMETPVERGFYESFSNPLFLPTTGDLFITHTTYKTFHGREGAQSAVVRVRCLHSLSLQELSIVQTKWGSDETVFWCLRVKHFASGCVHSVYTNAKRLRKQRAC